MTPKDKQFGYKETRKVVELLGFEYILTHGSHVQMKNKKTGSKTTLPFYKRPYGQRLIEDIAWQLDISKTKLVKLATDKKAFKEEKKKLQKQLNP